MAPTIRIAEVRKSLVRVPGSGSNPMGHNLSLNLARQIRNHENFPADMAEYISRCSSASGSLTRRVQPVMCAPTVTTPERPSSAALLGAPGRTTAQNDSERLASDPPSGDARVGTALSCEGEAPKKRTLDGASLGDNAFPRDMKSARVTATVPNHSTLVVSVRMTTMPPSTLMNLGGGHSDCGHDRSNTVIVAPMELKQTTGAGTTSSEHSQEVLGDALGGLQQPPAEGRTSFRHNLEVTQPLVLSGGDHPAPGDPTSENPNSVNVGPSSQLQAKALQKMRDLLHELEEKIKEDELEKEKLRKDRELLLKKVTTFREIFQDTGKLNAVLKRLNIKVY